MPYVLWVPRLQGPYAAPHCGSERGRFAEDVGGLRALAEARANGLVVSGHYFRW